MLATLLLTTALLTSAPTTDIGESRQAGAEVLWSTLGRLDALEDDAERWSLLLSGGETAVVALEDSTLGDELALRLADARATEPQQRDTAAARLASDLRKILADLEFEPILEAALPEGFPAPTPVGEIELKRYPLYRLARADSAGGNGAFWQLFQHIQKHDIPMTAPVEMTYDASGDEVEMAFMYEHSRQGQTGQDGAVEVTDIEPMLVVSIGCRSWSSEAAVAAAVAKLSTWVGDRVDIEIAGPMRRLGYNGPSVRGDQRYFEVQIPVRQLESDEPARGEGEDAAASEAVLR